MSGHSFICQSGSWYGEGKIQLNMVDEALPFLMIWTVSNKDSFGKIQCVQEVRVEGITDVMRNEFSFYDFKKDTFTVEMNNSNIGRVIGTGILDPNIIGWEFRENDLRFEGIESYRIQEDGSYFFQAEFMTQEELRTQIEGMLWKNPHTGNSIDTQTNQEGTE